jgi:HD-like signal output (HDOD) protein
MEAMGGYAGVEPSEAYSVGLLRSIGKIAIEGFIRDSIHKESFDPRSGKMLAEWEKGMTGFTNCEAAAFVLNEWHFPAGVSAAIAAHYHPEIEAPESNLAHLLSLAAGAADELGFGIQGEEPYWKRSKSRLAAAGIDEEQYEASCRAANTQFAKLRSAVG